MVREGVGQRQGLGEWGSGVSDRTVRAQATHSGVQGTLPATGTCLLDLCAGWRWAAHCALVCALLPVPWELSATSCVCCTLAALHALSARWQQAHSVLSGSRGSRMQNVAAAHCSPGVFSPWAGLHCPHDRASTKGCGPSWGILDFSRGWGGDRAPTTVHTPGKAWGTRAPWICTWGGGKLPTAHWALHPSDTASGAVQDAMCLPHIGCTTSSACLAVAGTCHPMWLQGSGIRAQSAVGSLPVPCAQIHGGHFSHACLGGHTVVGCPPPVLHCFCFQSCTGCHMPVDNRQVEDAVKQCTAGTWHPTQLQRQWERDA